MSANAQYQLVAVELVDSVNLEKKKGGAESLKEIACGLPESETGFNSASMGAGAQKKGSRLIKTRAGDRHSVTSGAYEFSVNRVNGVKEALGDKKDEGDAALQKDELAQF